MKKIFAIVMCLCMIMSMFAGCAKTEEPVEPTEAATETIAPVETEPVVEWTIYADETDCDMPAEVAGAFEVASDAFKDVDIEPIAYIATRTGEAEIPIYRFLCRGVPVDAANEVEEDAEANDAEVAVEDVAETEAIVESAEVPEATEVAETEPEIEEASEYKLYAVEVSVVSEEGDALVTSISEVDMNELLEKNSDFAEADVIEESNAGWTRYIDQKEPAELPEDVATAVSTVVDGKNEVYMPLAYLGNAEVDGVLTHAILVRETVAEGMTPTLNIMFIAVAESAELVNMINF